MGLIQAGIDNVRIGLMPDVEISLQVNPLYGIVPLPPGQLFFA